MCLRDMIDQRQKSVLPKKLWNLAGNYKVNLISMRFIPETELEKMDSDLKYVLGIMKRSKNKKEFAEYIRQNRKFFSRIPKSVWAHSLSASGCDRSIYEYEGCAGQATVYDESGERGGGNGYV